MPKYWMLNDRNNGGIGSDWSSGGLTFWVSNRGPLDELPRWKKVTAATLQKLLVAAVDQFPIFSAGQHERQKHLTILIPDNNPTFAKTTRFSENVYNRLFDGPDSLGLCVLFNWPSSQPERCAEDLTDALSALFDWFMHKQEAARYNPRHLCKAKISVISYGTGTYVLQKAIADTWRRKYRPQVKFINQLLMVAPNVSNNLFDAGSPDYFDGLALVNLTYRIVALYSARDSLLAAAPSAPTPSYTRPLGCAGLANRPPLGDAPHIDNVWDIDCSRYFEPSVDSVDIHSAYFFTNTVIDLMRQILIGRDPAVEEFPERRNQSRVGGVKTIIYDSRTMGDHIEQHISGGTFNAQVAAVMKDCTNIIDNRASGEQKRLLETLQKQVAEVLVGPPEEKLQLKKKLTSELKELTEGVTSGTPDRAWYSVSAKGLLEAAKFVKDFTGEIGETLKNLGRTLWPDFTL
jgi:hypothetical protein